MLNSNEPKPLNKKELRRIPQAVSLRRPMAFERQLIRVMGAWISRLRHAEAKYMAARHLWEWTTHVDKLRRRLAEMPGGKPDAALEENLSAILEEAMFAEDEAPFVEVLYTVLLPALRDAYLTYKQQTNELSDRPTVHILEEVIGTLSEQIQTGTEFLHRINGGAPRPLYEWTTHIAELLMAAGGLYSETVTSEAVDKLRKYAGHSYEPPEVMHRTTDSHYSYEHPIEGYLWSHNLKGDPSVERAALAVWLYNEMDEAEYISPILYEIKGMPWEFYYDVARHTWDEARHSEFGFKLMQSLGFKPEEFEVWVATYMSSMKLKPYERYAAVTCWYEPGSFQVKPDYLERLAQEVGGDDLAVELLRFDLADETLHVSFGHKWVEKLMRHHGDERSLDEFVNYVKQKGSNLREEQARTFVRTMPIEERHTLETIREHMERWMEEKGTKTIKSR
jgi:hypothetical protein